MRALVATIVTVLAAAALQAHPGAAIAVGPRGEIYFVDTGGGNFVIERGVVKRLPGPAFHWFAVDARGAFAKTQWPYIPGAEFHAAGSNPTLILSSDYPVAISTDGNFNYPQLGPDGRLRIVSITPRGERSVRATLPGLLRWVNGLAAGPGNSLYYTTNAGVGKIDARGTVSTVVDNVTVSDCATIPHDEPPPLPYLRGLTVDADGNLFVAASGCGALLRIRGRAITTVLRTKAPWSPTAVAKSGSDLYVLEYLHTAVDDRRQWLPRVRKVSAKGVMTIVYALSSRL